MSLSGADLQKFIKKYGSETKIVQFATKAAADGASGSASGAAPAATENKADAKGDTVLR